MPKPKKDRSKMTSAAKVAKFTKLADEAGIPASVQIGGQVVPLERPKKEPETRRRTHIEYDPKEIQKIRKKLGDVAVAAIEEKSDEELRSYLSDLAIYEEETAVAKASDGGLNEAKDVVKELAGPYNDTAKGIKLRRRIVCDMLQSRGKL